MQLKFHNSSAAVYGPYSVVFWFNFHSMDSDRAGLRKCGARGSRGMVCGGSKGRGLGRGCENDLCGDAILAYFCDQFALIVSIYNL